MKNPVSALPPPHALRLRLLGPLELSRPDGTSLGSVLTQPKRLALLAFLALGGDGGFLRRDVLLNFFWPEFDQERARSALRKALYFLRQSLGDGVIVARGDEELGIDPGRLWCDALAFQSAAAADRLDDALGLYRGDLLAGFFVTGQPDFENWAEGERVRLRLHAARAAEKLSDRKELDGDLEGALGHAQTALELDAASEPAFRRLAGVLYRRGDHAGLAHAYEAWRNRLEEAYGIQPAAETQELVASLLAGATHGTDSARAAAPHAATAQSDHAAAAGNPAPTAVRRSRRPLVWAGAAATLAVLFAAAVFVRAEPTMKSERVLVTELENDTGDPSLDAVSKIVADWIANGLMQTGNVEVVSTTSVLFETADGAATGSADLAKRTGAGTVVSGRYFLENGALHLQAQVTDAKRGRLLHAVSPIRVAVDSVTAGAELLRQRVATALAARFDWPAEWTELTRRSQPPTYAAYTEFVQGWDAFSRVLFSGKPGTQQAASHFERAWALDTTFHLARLYAVLMYSNTGQFERADSVLRSVAQRFDQLAPVERLLLEHFQAVEAGDHERSLRSARRLHKLAPNSMLAGYTALAVATNRPREAIAVHRDFNPEHGLLKAEELYWRWFTVALHMVGDYGRELQDTRQSRVRQPELMGPLFVEARALAGLGRTEEVERVLEQTLALPRQDFTPGAVMLHTAAELRAHGHHDAAASVLSKAIAWHDARPPEERGALRETLGRTYYEAQRWQEAYALFRQLAAEQPHHVLRLGFLGTSAARLGNRVEAERISAALAALPNQRGGYHYMWRARIAAVLGDRDQAIDLLQQGFASGLRHELWLHTERDFDSLRRAARFRALVRIKG